MVNDDLFNCMLSFYGVVQLNSHMLAEVSEINAKRIKDEQNHVVKR